MATPYASLPHHYYHLHMCLCDALGLEVAMTYPGYMQSNLFGWGVAELCWHQLCQQTVQHFDICDGEDNSHKMATKPRNIQNRHKSNLTILTNYETCPPFRGSKRRDLPGSTESQSDFSPFQKPHPDVDVTTSPDLWCQRDLSHGGGDRYNGITTTTVVV